MGTIRRKTWAVILMATLFGAATTPMMVASAQQQRCARDGHRCGTISLIASCCCGHRHDSAQPSTAGTDAQRAPAPPTTLLGSVIAAIAPVALDARVQSSPMRGSPPDFPTLYATLLI